MKDNVRSQICEIGRRIWTRGMCAGNEGNISVRIGANRILCTPTGVSKGFMSPGDLCVVDFAGQKVAGRRSPTSEIQMHIAIYRERPDVKAVVHAHPIHATAFAVTGVDLPMGVHPEAELFVGKVPTAPFVVPGDQRLGESIAPFLKGANTILMQSHGVVCFHADLEQAYYQLEIVESYARLLLLARQIGKPRKFSRAEIAGLARLKMRFQSLK